jgi:hypothetical protein
MIKTFEEDPELVTLANAIITKHKLDLNSVTIRYVLVGPYISKTVHGRCLKANNELKFFGACDYLIEFSKDIWELLDDKTKEALMFHELLHPLIKTSTKGQMVPSIVDHDIKDFRRIIKEYGPDWFQNFRDIVKSTYELEPNDMDKIKV